MAKTDAQALTLLAYSDGYTRALRCLRIGLTLLAHIHGRIQCLTLLAHRDWYTQCITLFAHRDGYTPCFIRLAQNGGGLIT